MLIGIIFLLSVIAALVLALAVTGRKVRMQGGLRRARAARQGNKWKILERLGHNLSVTNDDAHRLLQVLDATAGNYLLEELESVGLIVQLGKTDRGVAYRKNG